MNYSLQANKQADEAFYKYNLVTGSYEYIIPLSDEPDSLFLQEWLKQGGDGISKLVHPDDHAIFQAHFKQWQQRQPDRIHEASHEYRLRMKDGNYRWFIDRHVLVFGDNAQPHALVGSIREISTEKEFANTLQTYAHIVSAASDYLALIDRQYTYKAVSAAFAKALQKHREEVLGRPVAEIMGAEVFDNILKPMADRCLAGEEVTFQLWHGFPNGQRRLLDIVYTPHFEKGQKQKTISAYIERAKDITNIAKLEEQLRQSCKLETIGMLTGSIAHDFNNILSAILGYSEISLKMTIKDSELHRYLKNILDASIRATDLVKQILNFSRKDEQDIRPVQIKNIVDELLALIRASFPPTITIKRELQSEAFVMGNGTQIYQILMNLCSNAGYAMREHGGVLKVSLSDIEPDDFFIAQHQIRPGRYSKLTVSDTGIGMTPDIQKRILDPFFTTKEKGKGTGIGLSLTHDIIKSYGGALTVHSAPGKGATFNVFLPSIDDRRFYQGEIVEPLPTGHESILFIDDEDTLADLGKQMIESLGYRVTSRVNSLEALSMFQNHPEDFDLVITDLMMPNLTGDKLLKKIHGIRPDIPVILVTGLTEQMTHEKALALGARRLAIKPVVMKDMARFIREALAKPVS